MQRNPQGYIIQPFLEFEYEPSFFFVDNQFHHALWSQHRLLNDEVALYDSTPSDLAFAEQFVQWAGFPYGIQRIDAIRTQDGELLLTEIENLCPYLYFSEVGEGTKLHFLNAFRESLLRVFVNVVSLNCNF